MPKEYEGVVLLGNHVVLGEICESQEDALTQSKILLTEFLKENPETRTTAISAVFINIDE